MALAVDAVSSAVGAGAGAFSWSHVNAGDVLFLATSWYRTIVSPTTPTFNGDALTAVPSSLIQDGDYNVQWWYLIAPDIGTFNFSTGFSGASFDAGFWAISFTGGHQTTPYGTPATGSSTSTSFSATVTSAIGEIVIDATIITHSGTYSVGAGQTSRQNAIATNGFVKVSGSSEPGDTSVAMSWDNSSSQFQVRSAVPVKPASAGSSAGPLMSSQMLKSLVGGALVS